MVTMNSEFKRMMQLAGLNEIKINRPNPLGRVQSYKSQAESKPQTRDKIDLVLKCIESLLYMFEDTYPGNNSPRKTIEAAKKCMYDPNEENSYDAYRAYDDNDSNYRENQLDRDDVDNKQQAAAIISAEAGWAAYQAHNYASFLGEPDQRKHYLTMIDNECILIFDNLIKAIKIYYNI